MRSLACLLLVVPALAGCLDDGGLTRWIDPSDPVAPPWCTPESDPYCGTLDHDEDGPLRFVVPDEALQGSRVEVRLQNVGERTFVYSVYYTACDLEYSTEDHRYFIIPPGTHCDLANTAEIAPGEQVHLFDWDLDECIEDNWGCSRARDLPPGLYHVRGTFWESDGEESPWRDEDAVRTGFDIRVL